MTTPMLTDDDYANLYAQVHIEELDEWALMLIRLEEWFGHACEETVEDWNEFTSPCGPRIDDLIYVLGHFSIRMRNLATGRS